MKREWPKWFGGVDTAELAACPCCRAGFHLRRVDPERTLRGVARNLEGLFVGGRWAGRHGYLQGLHPPVRMVLLLCLLVVTTFLRSHLAIGLSYALALSLAAASGVPLRTFCSEVWKTIPLFSGLLALPVLFNFVTPGEPLWTLFRSAEGFRFFSYALPAELSITRPGLLVASLLVVRVGTCVSYAALLTMTSRQTDLLRALSAVPIPRLYVLTLEMTLRFLTLLLRTVQAMFLARNSRLVRRLRATEERHFAASRAAALFHRALFLSEEVHAAMRSRGFSGEFHALPSRPQSRPGKAAIAWPIAAGLALVVMQVTGVI